MIVVGLEFPRVIRVNDYHEFDYILNVLDFPNNVKYTEVGVGLDRKYIGVLFTKKDSDYRKLVKECQEEVDDMEGSWKANNEQY